MNDDEERGARARAAYAAGQAIAEYMELPALAHLRDQSPAVWGEGPLNAPVVLVGEAPGAEEVRRKRPFVGPSGQLLEQLLAENNLPRGWCYITNTVLYRPPGNRTPESFEVAASRPRLLAEIAAVRPALVVTLGATARKALRPGAGPVTQAHGRIERLADVLRSVPASSLPACGLADFVLLPTFHPSAALRDPAVLGQMREDLKWLSTVAGSKMTP